MFIKILNRTLLLGFISVLLISCSSSSNSQRYDKPAEKESDTSASSVRFTSKEKKVGEKKFKDTGEVDSEFDEVPTEDFPVSNEEFVNKFSEIKSFSAALTTREKILFEIINYLDTPYLYGGVGKDGIDCSAFTQNVFSNSIGLNLPRTASEQFTSGVDVDENELAFGDLIFFNTTTRSYPGHVGIYLGEDLFAHASRSLGVTVSSLKSTYYKNRFIGARRIK